MHTDPQFRMSKLAIITYDRFHTKTAMLAGPLVQAGKSVTFLEVDFKARKSRSPRILHRPEMFPEDAADPIYASIPRARLEEASNYDLIVIGGAGILPAHLVEKKIILNGHAGLLPYSRGLDAFKWALLLDKPLGVTAHLIDHQTDAGYLVMRRETPIFAWDTLETLASRHFRNEIALLIEASLSFDPSIAYPSLTTESPATMRMPLEVETELVAKFPAIRLKRAAPMAAYQPWW